MSQARNKFIVRVYTILAFQLSFTALVVMAAMSSQSFAAFQANNPGVAILCFIITFAVLMMMRKIDDNIECCSQTFSETFPTNMIMLAIFTFCESYLVSFICSMYEPQSVLLAAVATAGASIGLTAYAIYTKSDFSTYWSQLNGKL